MNGGSASLMLYPEDELVVAVLVNSRQGAPLDVKSLGDVLLSCK